MQLIAFCSVHVLIVEFYSDFFLLSWIWWRKQVGKENYQKIIRFVCLKYSFVKFCIDIGISFKTFSVSFKFWLMESWYFSDLSVGMVKWTKLEIFEEIEGVLMWAGSSLFPLQTIIIKYWLIANWYSSDLLVGEGARVEKARWRFWRKFSPWRRTSNSLEQA